MSYPSRGYAVSPDGQTFYARRRIAAEQSLNASAAVTRISLVTNWVQELKAKVAAGHPR